MGGLYEVDKNAGGTVTKTTVYYPGGAMRINGTLYYVQMTPSVLRTSPPNTQRTVRMRIQNFHCVFGGEPIASRDGESLEGVGETRLSTGTMYTDKLFTGQREMTGLGIYHYQSRFYSPKLGRFLSADTIVPNPFNPQDYNRFAYVRNNPVRYIDPSGYICVQNGGGLDEFAMPGNCNGGPDPDYRPPLPGGVPTVNKPGKPNKPQGNDGGGRDIPELSKDDDANADVPGQCDWAHCHDEWYPVDTATTIRIRSWNEIDKLDLTVDVLGILGDAALYFGGPPGAIFWIITEIPEVLTIGRAWDQMEMNDMTGGVDIVFDIIGAGADTERALPIFGILGNLVSIGLNVIEVKVEWVPIEEE